MFNSTTNEKLLEGVKSRFEGEERVCKFDDSDYAIWITNRQKNDKNVQAFIKKEDLVNYTNYE